MTVVRNFSSLIAHQLYYSVSKIRNFFHVGTFGGNERSIPSSGFGNGFLPVKLEVQRASGRSNSKRLFSSSIQSRSDLAPVAEDIPWDLPEPSFKLRRLFESSPTHDPCTLLAR
ncbi:hypothetical protein GIB67_007130 [Kingdonia uniflora]|uniref:Uncharacterized protein n=1 Tax=Kingdonia uniflora TaxID=39325 RepID=A0A7J7MLC9_9MAGN|nr:hypothetical protein GIB67_007130 [Kingdonia uniflora]